MRVSLICAAATLLTCTAPIAARAISLDQACQTFASRLSAAEASGDQQRAQTIYQEGTQRIASRFNGATCPNIKAPTP